MKALNLPSYSFRIKQDENGKRLIFDDFRKKWVALTPEEWVRQHFAAYLVEEKSYPPALVGTEVSFRYNRLSRRADIIVYSREGKAVMIVECKAPEVNISRAVFDQIIEYNFRFKLNYIVVTNGLKHYACHIDYSEGANFTFLETIPGYADLEH